MGVYGCGRETSFIFIPKIASIVQGLVGITVKEFALESTINQTSKSVNWEGIIIGQSTLLEARKILGTPTKEFSERSTDGTLWMIYEYEPYIDLEMGANYSVEIQGIARNDQYYVMMIKVEYYNIYSDIPFMDLPKLSSVLIPYGKPDAVLWGGCYVRYLVWEKEGISVGVSIGNLVEDSKVSFEELKVFYMLYSPPISYDLTQSINWPTSEYYLSGIISDNPCKGRDDFPIDPFGWSLFSIFNR